MENIILKDYTIFSYKYGTCEERKCIEEEAKRKKEKREKD